MNPFEQQGKEAQNGFRFPIDYGQDRNEELDQHIASEGPGAAVMSAPLSGHLPASGIEKELMALVSAYDAVKAADWKSTSLTNKINAASIAEVICAYIEENSQP